MPRMDPKPRPNHERYIRALREMGPERRLLKAFELSDRTKDAFLEGLRRRFPDRTEPAIRRLALEHMARCRSRDP